MSQAPESVSTTGEERAASLDAKDDDGNAVVDSYAEFMVNNLWICISAALVFIMHLGFTTLEAGLTQKKNAVNIIFKNVWIICSGVLLYAAWGFNAMYPGDSWLYTDVFAMGSWFGQTLNDPSQTTAAYNAGYTWWGDFIFQAMFAATGATIVSGAVAERVKLPVFMLFSTLLVGFAYPVTGSWHWGGGLVGRQWISRLCRIERRSCIRRIRRSGLCNRAWPAHREVHCRRYQADRGPQHASRRDRRVPVVVRLVWLQWWLGAFSGPQSRFLRLCDDNSGRSGRWPSRRFLHRGHC